MVAPVQVAEMNMRMALSFRAALVIVVCACADSARENVFDPVNTPSLEMLEPVLDGGSVLIEWRYLSETASVTEFRVARIVLEDTTVIANLPVTAASPDWQSVSFRDSTVAYGQNLTYRVAALNRRYFSA